MSRPGDFSLAVKEALAKRAGFKCSFPSCEAPTVGPSEESSTATNTTGMACHIAAASSGGSARRVLQGATPAELSAISNGIWMCYRHGKLIDADEHTFTIPMLTTWREIAELKARLSHELGRDVRLDPRKMEVFRLPDDEVVIPHLGRENALVGDALKYSCLADIWGRDVADAVRDACIELIRNALTHGGARSASLFITASTVMVEDDGAPFNSADLRSSPSGGGGESLRIIAEQFRTTALFSYKRQNSKNQSTFAFLRRPSDLSAFSPCTVSISFDDMLADSISIRAIEGCDVTYVVLPSYFALSDIFKLPDLLASAFPERPGCKVVLVTSELSAGAVQLLERTLPHIEVINFSDDVG